jgi:hypothetical protein
MFRHFFVPTQDAEPGLHKPLPKKHLLYLIRLLNPDRDKARFSGQTEYELFGMITG